jgi:regulator of cell morphogenesis and NO signaling
VAEQPARSRVFEGFGIDYCCGGKRTLADACVAKGLDLRKVTEALNALDVVSEPIAVDWTKTTMTTLADHIERTHHQYLREALPRLSMLTQKVANAHGAKDGRLIELREVFTPFRKELEEHMWKEEAVLFPLMRKMDRASSFPPFHVRTIESPIRVMVAEHDDSGAALATMRELTDGYRAPEDACGTYRAMLDALAELERDMHQHVHLENNVLFPMAVSRESSPLVATAQ